MHDQLTNQEIARLKHAEILREARRTHARPSGDAAEPAAPAIRRATWLRRLAWRVAHAPTLGSH